MKQIFRVGFLLAAFAGVFSSCGPKLMTDAEMTSKVDELYNKQAETVTAQMDKSCNAGMEARVKVLTDSIVEAYKATPVQ